MSAMLVRRLLFALLLPVLLLAQQGALVHELSHVHHGLANTRLDGDKHQPPGERACDKCFAFAPLGAAVSPSLVLAGAARSVGEAIALPDWVLAGVDRGLVHCRGPPASF